MREDTLMILAVFGVINTLVLAGIIIYLVHSRVSKRVRQNKVDHFGDSAEKKVIDFLKKSFPKATVMESVYLKTPTGLTELDILMLCDRGLFIVEVKSHNGQITTEGKYWTQRWRDKIVRFHSPVLQNSVHKTALDTVFRKRQSFASLPVYTVTVFTSNNVTFTKNVRDVIKFSSLYSYVKRKKPDKRMTKDMIRQVEKFIRTNMETSRMRQNRHKRKIYNSNAKKRAYRVNK